MEPLKPLKPLGAPQGVKPLAPVSKPGTPIAPASKPVETKAPVDTSGSYNKLFGGEAPKETKETKEVKEVASKVAQQMVDAVQKKADKAKPKTKPKTSADDEDDEDGDVPKDKKPAKAAYSGPRHIKVYGNLLFTEEDPKVSLETIRKRVVEEFGFEEFSASRTKMSLDEETGIVVPEISFQKKG